MTPQNIVVKHTEHTRKSTNAGPDRGTMPSDDTREFFLVVYRALKMITSYLEKRYKF